MDRLPDRIALLQSLIARFSDIPYVIQECNAFFTGKPENYPENIETVKGADNELVILAHLKDDIAQWKELMNRVNSAVPMEREVANLWAEMLKHWIARVEYRKDMLWLKRLGTESE